MRADTALWGAGVQAMTSGWVRGALGLATVALAGWLGVAGLAWLVRRRQRAPGLH